MLRSRRMLIVLLTAWGALVGGACSSSPRNGDRLQHAWGPMTWAGATVATNQLVMLVTGDADSAFSSGNFVGAAYTASAASKDAAGVDWYPWSTSLTLPTSGIWKLAGPNTLQTSLKTYVVNGDGTPGLGPLATFDVGSATDTCLRNYGGQGVSAVINNCHSSQSGVVTVTAPCGTFTEACCIDQCDSGLACDASQGKCLMAAGSSCQANSDCTSHTNCFAGVCSQWAWARLGDFIKFFTDTKTYAYTGSSLSGAGTSVQFTPNEEPGQDLTVYDWPYSFDPGGQGGSDTIGDVPGGKWACLPTHFTRLTVAAGESLTVTVQPGTFPYGNGVSHVVRYAHGSCWKRVDWKTTFFEPFSSTFKSVAEQTLKDRIPGLLQPFTSFSRDFDIAQAQFRSEASTTDWGFFYEGSFYVTVLGVSTHLLVSPAYAFSPSVSDGFVDVKPLTQGVVLIPDVTDAKPAIQNALATGVPIFIAAQIRATMEIPVATIFTQLQQPIPGDLGCSSSDPIETQQQTCFDKVQPLLGPFASLVELRHFSCNQSNQCAVHPIVQAVNVLPESLELVFAPDFTGGPDTLTSLYQQVGACDPTDTPPDSGYIATLSHGDNAYATACGPILPQ